MGQRHCSQLHWRSCCLTAPTWRNIAIGHWISYRICAHQAVEKWRFRPTSAFWKDYDWSIAFGTGSTTSHWPRHGKMPIVENWASFSHKNACVRQLLQSTVLRTFLPTSETRSVDPSFSYFPSSVSLLEIPSTWCKCSKQISSHFVRQGDFLCAMDLVIF